MMQGPMAVIDAGTSRAPHAADVIQGKPHPETYVKAASLPGVISAIAGPCYADLPESPFCPI